MESPTPDAAGTVPVNSHSPLQKLQAEIIGMQNEVVGRAKYTQGLILAMTLVAFVMGTILLLLAVIQGVRGSDPVFTVLSSAGGFGTVATTVWYNPMKRAQRSMGDLVQTQVAFLAFNSQITIWTEFVIQQASKASFQDPVVKGITEDIQNAASVAMTSIQKFCQPPGEK